MTRLFSAVLTVVVVAALGMPAMTYAQETPSPASPPIATPPANDSVTQFFEIAGVPPSEVARIVSVLAGNKVSLTATDGEHPVLLASGPKEIVEAIGELLELGSFRERGPLSTEVFHLKHVDRNMAGVILGVFERDGATIVMGSERSGMVAVTAPPEVLKQIGETVARLDVPPDEAAPNKNTELTVHLLVASSKEDAAAGDMPEGLSEVVEELKGTFAYAKYRLWETLLFRCRDGEEVESSSVVPSLLGAAEEAGPSMVQFRARNVELESGDDGRIVRIDDLTVGVEIPVVQSSGRGGASSTRKPTRVSRHDMGLKTNVDIREGQKVVVGKASVDISGQEALFVVLTARVVE